MTNNDSADARANAQTSAHNEDGRPGACPVDIGDSGLENASNSMSSEQKSGGADDYFAPDASEKRPTPPISTGHTDSTTPRRSSPTAQQSRGESPDVQVHGHRTFDDSARRLPSLPTLPTQPQEQLRGNSPSTPTSPDVTRETPTMDGRPIPDDLIEACDRADYAALRASTDTAGLPLGAYDQLSDRIRRVRHRQTRAQLDRWLPIIAAHLSNPPSQPNPSNSDSKEPAEARPVVADVARDGGQRATGAEQAEARVAVLEGTITDEALIRRAIADPGQFLPRGDNYAEQIASWSARAVVAALAGVGSTPNPSDETAVEIGGVVMTQAQFDAARAPLLAGDPGPAVPGDEMSVTFPVAGEGSDQDEPTTCRVRLVEEFVTCGARMPCPIHDPVRGSHDVPARCERPGGCVCQPFHPGNCRWLRPGPGVADSQEQR